MAPDQQGLIDELLEHDKFMLLVLDACRYDYMARWSEEFHPDLNVQRVESGVPNTHTWVRTRWSGEYDIVYISPVPYVGNKTIDGPTGGGPYNGGDHFKKVVEAWRDNWDDVEGCVTPGSCARLATENEYPRMVVHFGQPHMPHIGDPPMRNDEIESNNLTQVGKSGEFSDEYIRRSYYGNLKRVMDEGVKKLVRLGGGNDRKVVITADHGESLGEGGKYGHNNLSKEVRFVPWVEIE